MPSLRYTMRLNLALISARVVIAALLVVVGWFMGHGLSLPLGIFAAALLCCAGAMLSIWSAKRYWLQPVRQLAEHVRLEHDFGNSGRAMPFSLYSRQDSVGHLARQLQKLIEELRNHNAALLEQTLNDPLTGLGNRRMLENRLDMIVPLSRRLHCTVSAIMIDVDHFKSFNDNYGHPAGDACLVEIAGVLRDVFRRDTDVVVRLGGEEFLVLLINTVQEEALALADAMRGMIQALGMPHAYSPVAPVVTVSVGVVTSPEGILADIDDMITYADQALYDCKAHGRNRVAARLVGEANDITNIREPVASEDA